MRTAAPSEKKLHRAIRGRDVAEGASKGGLLGAAVGAGLKRMGHKAGPLAGAAVGAAVGGAAGGLRGQERVMRDVASQERQHIRSEARTKRSAFDAALADALTKEAFLPAVAGLAARATPMLASLGRAVVGGGMRAANAAGMGQAATGLVRKGLRSSPNLMRNVGIGTLGAGAAGLAGAGLLASRN